MSGVSHQAIKAFVLTEKLGSISAAAKAMGKNRAQLSQWISNLEIDWNVELFTRSGHKPTLTSAGSRMLARCQLLVETAQAIEKEVQLVSTVDKIHLRLGLSIYFAPAQVAQLLALFHQKYPHVDLEVIQRRDEQLLNWHDSFDLDLIFCIYHDAYPADVSISPIGNLEFVGVCHKDHPLAALRDTSTTQVLEHTWITLRSDSDAPLWEPRHIQRQIQVEEQALAIELCLKAQGVMWAVKGQVQRYLDSGELVVVDHEDAQITETVGVVHANQASNNEQTEHLISLVKQVFSPAN